MRSWLPLFLLGLFLGSVSLGSAAPAISPTPSPNLQAFQSANNDAVSPSSVNVPPKNLMITKGLPRFERIQGTVIEIQRGNGTFLLQKPSQEVVTCSLPEGMPLGTKGEVVVLHAGTGTDAVLRTMDVRPSGH